MHVASNQFSNKFSNDNFFSRWPFITIFYLTLPSPCVRDNFESFPCILRKFIMHVSNNQCSDMLSNGAGLFSSVLLLLIRLRFFCAGSSVAKS